jgi:preprotein translocase subunit SecA
MLNFITDLFDDNKKTLVRYNKIVDQINALEPAFKKLSDKQLAGKTAQFKKTIVARTQAGESEQAVLNELLPEAFATVREVSRRVMGMRHFDVQLLAGIALHYGTVTEQKTGEGKTLTVTAPLYLNALLGKGAHLVTVNDYLAELGAGWMGPVYNFLGMTTAVIVHDHSKKYNPDVDSEERGDERLEHWEMVTRGVAYRCDITYGTNNEFGFDYLRDNMVQRISDMAQRESDAHYYAIVDEADSILIDEARTPLIISAPDAEPTKKYYEYSTLVQSLDTRSDYSVDEKARSVTLTDLGVKRLERKLNISNLYEESFDMIHHIEAALKAKTIFTRDKDYIVRENQVVIVDEHTGRLMYGRRYSDGLHQAIEAKEGVPIQQESRTLATISIQNYFRQYEKLSGMTGTASTEAEEFEKIYQTQVLVIPTHRPISRKDTADIVYKTTAAKYSAIVTEIERIHATGQPLLVGTRSISNNQVISEFLRRKKIPHQALNAKNHEKEAFIIADAGKPGAITVATNIAGRGVDIVLGGSKPELKDYRKTTEKAPTAAQKERAVVQAKELKLQLPPSVDPARYDLKNYKKALDSWQAAHDQVVSFGGLYIIGSERHESRRIDNQLRGRSGRQGDPGATQFFVSLEDEIMRLFGGEQISKLMDFLKIDEGQPIEHGMIGKSIESAQVKVEGFFFDQRKRVVEFDDVMNKQREIIYKRRRQLLEYATNQSPELQEDVLTFVTQEVSAVATLNAPQEYTEQEFFTIAKEFSKIIPLDPPSQERLAKSLSTAKNPEDVKTQLITIATKAYESKEKQLGANSLRQLELAVCLSTLDEQWMNHLDSMDSLREGIWLRGDKKTVLSAYKKEGFEMFDHLISRVESETAHKIFRAHFHQHSPIPQNTLIEHKDTINEELAKEVADATLPTARANPSNTKGSLGDLASALKTATAKVQPKPGVKKEKISRNEPCPCGSGLKYKKCGLINAPQHRG